MEARKLCPPETFSVINHNQKKLLAYNYWRQKEGYNIRKNGKPIAHLNVIGIRTSFTITMKINGHHRMII